MIGTQVSHYRILSKVGAGGMGEVYLAQDLQLDRKVALKFLSAEDSLDAAGRHRLLREANAAARLDHPFITKVYEISETTAANGKPFIAMELVEGLTLRERLDSGPLPLSEALRITSEIAEALEYASQRGVVHRDLKPANIMITAGGHAKVMDFGIAKIVSADVATGLAGGASVTAAGVIQGTPAYMAPEHLRGEVIDSRADIFALGVCFYEMLTRVHPFVKDTAFATAESILNQPVPPLDRHTSNLPPLLEEICQRALAKAAADRYQSFKDFRTDLDRVQVHTSVTASPASASASAPVAAPRGSRRQRLVAAVIVLGLVVAAASFMAWRWRWSPSQPALAFAERDWIIIADCDNLTGEAVFDRSLRAGLDVAIAQSQYVNVFPQSRLPETLRMMKRDPAAPLDESAAREVAVRERLKAVLTCSISKVGESYLLTAKVLDPQSGLAVRNDSAQARNKDGVLKTLDDLAAAVRRNLGESLSSVSAQRVDLPRATTSSLEALKFYAESRRAAEINADDLLTQAIAIDPDFALAHAALGHALYLRSDAKSRALGEEHFVRALGLLDRLSHRERLWIRGLAEDSRGNREAAASAYRALLAEYPDDGSAWFRLGWLYMTSLRQPNEAVDAFRQVIKLNPSDASAHINLATSLHYLGRLQESADQYQAAFRLEPTSKLHMLTNHEYGFLLVELKDLAGAEAVFKEMTEQSSTASQARGLRSLALLDMYRGRFRSAIDRFRQAVVINRANRSVVSEYRDRLFLVRAYRALGRQPEFATELDAVQRLASSTPLAPEWLRRIGKIDVRANRIPVARGVLEAMSKTEGDATAGSSVNRSTSAERSHFDVVQGEIDLAEGRPQVAVDLFRNALVSDPGPDTLDSLAAALMAAGQLDEAAKTFEQLIERNDINNEGLEQWQNAHVRLAELYVRLGRRDDARGLCEKLLALWQDADPDLILAQQARALLKKIE